MPEIKVIKHGGFKYGVGADRKQYGKGSTIVAKQKDARMLVAAKLAEYVEAAPEQAAAKPKTRAVSAKTGTRAASTAGRKVSTRKGNTVSASGTYDRRDMRAK